MRAILFNGPPRSGKDAAAAAADAYILNLTGHCSFQEKFSAPNKHAFAGMMQVPIKDWIVEHYEAKKEETIPELGVSFRRWQIDYSERFMKPLYGDEIFANLLLGRIDRAKQTLGKLYGRNLTCIISDCGFQIEVDTLLKAKVFSDVLVIRCNREGYNFSNDSRNWVNHMHWHERTTFLDLHNDGTLTEWNNTVLDTIQGWLHPLAL